MPVLLLAAACSGATPAAGTASSPTQTDANTGGTVGGVYSAPEWTRLPLVNARTGASFTLADFAGKTVYVHAMADW